MLDPKILCLMLFPLSVSAGCQEFLAINNWLGNYYYDCIELLGLLHSGKSRLTARKIFGD
jgi:hypothetical protein